MKRVLQTIACAASAGAIALPPTQGVAETPWKFSRTTDPLTDQIIATAIGESADGPLTRTAVVRCTGNKLEVFVDFGQFISNDFVDVKYRFDKEAVTESSWSASAEGTAVFADESREVARHLASGTSFVVEARDFEGQPRRAVFDLAGASASVTGVLSQCGVPMRGLQESIPGLRKEVALELERWGPKTTLVGKQILSSLRAYSGPIDTTIEPEFAIDVQKFHDNYVTACKVGTSGGPACKELRIYWSNGSAHYETAAAIMLEMASGKLKADFGNLKFGE